MCVQPFKMLFFKLVRLLLIVVYERLNSYVWQCVSALIIISNSIIIISSPSICGSNKVISFFADLFFSLCGYHLVTFFSASAGSLLLVLLFRF